ncbi:MAG: MSMEG_0567/Sll0786 family nitrogen starvation N-acetyltransferase [Actinomycetes bacterium]
MSTTDVQASPSSRSVDLTCRLVDGPGEIELHHAVRRQVFVVEQRLFEVDDRDEHDADPATRHVLGLVNGVAGGAVRLYPLGEPGLWKGDRLAVLAAFRRHGLGAPLVRFAVQTAGALGGYQMIAYIQLPNVAFFTRLGWHPVGDPASYVGVMHQQMAIRLGR